MALNVGNFAFHMLESRTLGPRSYGALGSLLGLLVIFQVPLSALEIAFTKSIASSGARTVEARAMTRRAVFAGLGVTGGLVAASPLLMRFLHLDTVYPVLGAAFAVLPTIVGLVPKSLLLGTMRFKAAARGMAASAVVKLVAASIFAATGRGVVFAMIAIGLGEIAALASFHLSARTQGPADVATFKASEVVLPSLAFMGFWVLASVDTLLARHFLSALEAGYYAAAANAAKAVLFLPGAIALSAFPRFADRTAPSAERRRVLRHALLVVSGMVVLAAGIVVALPGLFVSVLFGPEYDASASLVGLLAVAGAGLGVTQLLVFYVLARGSRLALLPWTTAVLLISVVILDHAGPLAIARTALLSIGAGMVVFLIAALRKGPEPRFAALAAADLDVSIVVPAFNPGSRLRPTVVKLLSVLQESGASHEVLVVSDGSNDDSLATLADLEGPNLVLLEHSRNEGKGEALRTGFSRSRGQYVGFIDADGDIDPVVLSSFLALARLYRPDVVLGSKRHPLSEVDYPVLRRLYSTVFQLLTRVLFRLNVRDTQTGVKLVHRSVLEAVLPRMAERGFCFDLELFVVARQLGFRRFMEAPVRIGVRFESTISPTSVATMIRDVGRIFWRHRVEMAFETPDGAADQDVPSLVTTVTVS